MSHYLVSCTISPYSGCGHINTLYIVTIGLSWKFVGELSKEPNAFISLAKLLFYVSIVNEFFIKMQTNMFLNSSLGDWCIIEIYGRVILLYTLPWKKRLRVVVLFWGMWVKRHFLCITPITNFIKIIKLWCWIILILNNWKKWCVIGKKLHHQAIHLCKSRKMFQNI